MRIPRIFQNKTLNIHDCIVLEPDLSHKLNTILRLPKNASVILFNGDGYEYTGTIVEATTKVVKIKILANYLKSCESSLKIHLGQVISKGEKMDFVIQKSTELGVLAIQPLFSERCVIHLKNDRLEKKLEHWQKIAIFAAEQSGRTLIPHVKKPITLAEWLRCKEIQEIPCRLLLDPNATSSLNNVAILDTVALLIGPEGGLTKMEIEDATENHFKGLRLGKRILRTETAAIAALSALQYKAGDF
jgi:16S rRNA (uracil1498-N3)-methyltransferase